MRKFLKQLFSMKKAHAVDVVNQQIGPEDSIKVSLEGGKVIISNSYQGTQVGADLSIKVDAKMLLDKLKVAIPGNWDDLVINVVEGALP